MKLLFFQWNAFMQKGIEQALKKLKIDFNTYYYVFKDWDNDDIFVDKFTQTLKIGGYDTVFSVNFSPLIALACDSCGIRYISWVYDCPMNIRRTDTIGLPNNKVYFFDRVQMEQYRQQGMNTVYHLPLAVDTELFAGLNIKKNSLLIGENTCGISDGNYDCDVSLLGKLYKSDFSYLCTPLDDYSRGYLEGCVSTQQQLPGGYVLNEMITDELMESLNKQYMKATNGEFKVLPAELEYALACEVTGRKRYMALALLQSRCKVNLYSNDNNPLLKQVNQLGYVDYYTQMPQVFAKSKINLNISLSAIQSGIPLRVLDIIGSGGFVMTNLQPELLEYFEPDYDIIIYQDIKDLVNKTNYYLNHEKHRQQIVKRGFDKVREAFNFEDRVRVMFE